MNAVSVVNVSAYCDLEKFSSDKFDPLIMNRIRVKSWELVTILPSPSSLVIYRSQIFIDHSRTNHQHFVSSYCTAHYTLHIAGTMLVGEASYYCLCFQLGVIICYAVSPSAVSSLFINNITHILPSQTKTAPRDDGRLMRVIKTCCIMNVLCGNTR